MILVDSSVWIDYFGGATSREANQLDALLGAEPLLTGDLILAEVLQGFTADRDFRRARKVLESFEVVSLAGQDVCIQAAHNFRALRRKGVTIRKTIDTVIATRCIGTEDYVHSGEISIRSWSISGCAWPHQWIGSPGGEP